MDRLNLRAFGRLVARVLETLPDEVKPYLENVVVDVEEEADLETLQDLGFTDEEIAAGETAYGLFVPFELPDTSGMDFHEPPHRIVVYRRPHVEDFPERKELLQQIRTTVLHELAHHFGYSDDDIDRWTNLS